MFSEYVGVLGGDVRDVLVGQVGPFFDMLRGSPLFWPALAAAGLLLLYLLKKGTG